MKLHFQLATFFALLPATLLIQSCNSNKNAILADLNSLSPLDMKVAPVDDDIAFAQKEIYSDYEKFIKEAKQKISRNEASIVRMKAKTTKMKKAARENSQKTIADISAKNVVLKAKLQLYIEDGVGNWHLFRTELFGELNLLDIEINNALAQK